MSEKFLEKLLSDLPEGTTEVMLHPGTDNKILQDFCGWQHDFEEESAAVTSPKILQLIDEKKIFPVSFGELEEK